MTPGYTTVPAPIGALNPEQHFVTQEGGTEAPFTGQYVDDHEPGIYVDVVSGEPLFASVDQFDSGTGWPCFTKPIDPDNVMHQDDRSHGMLRTEVRSSHGESHLGHVFDDGPETEGGLRYRINSAALRFVPLEDLDGEGYGDYRSLFGVATARDTIADVDASELWPGPVVTDVTPAREFWAAEPRTQKYRHHYPRGRICHYVRVEPKPLRRHTFGAFTVGTAQAAAHE